MAEYLKDYVNIGVKPHTKHRLTLLAKYGDSMDDVIIRLLDHNEEHA